MKKKNVFLVLTGVLLFVCILYFFSTRGPGSVSGSATLSSIPSAAGQPASDPMMGEQSADRDETKSKESKTGSAAYHPKDIEEIKKQIYDLNIEDVDDIPMLDSVVQTGDAPTKDLWLGGWASVDDNKDDVNGFKLEPQNDGTFMFYPDEATTRTYTFFETPKTYTYDPLKKEFFWEIDYYGKTITHRVRFINEDVVAMMLISGRKVTLDLYQKQPDKNE